MKGKGREQVLEHREGHCIDWGSWQELCPYRRMQANFGYKAKKDLGMKYLDPWLHFPSALWSLCLCTSVSEAKLKPEEKGTHWCSSYSQPHVSQNELEKAKNGPGRPKEWYPA